ncbi:MAG: DoxX family protein [Pseudomonadota bacterium]|nr:DoxX family protein [Pseudomonadota bacterium]
MIGVLALRLMTVALFLPFSALDKLLNFQGAVGQCRSVFKPKPLAVLVILCGLGIELFTSLAIITGFADRLGAVVLAAYCAITAVLFKQFWKPGDFWSRADGQGRNLFWDFLKNFALGGALLLLAFGPDGSHARDLLANPLASTHPYGSTAP